MAAGISNEMVSAQVSKRTVSDKNHVVCDCCGKTTAELNEVKLELSSFREIPRVLQEEIREISPSTQPTENKGNEGYENKAPYTLINERRTDFLLIKPTKKTTVHKEKPPTANLRDLKPVCNPG